MAEVLERAAKEMASSAPMDYLYPRDPLPGTEEKSQFRLNGK